MRTTYLLASAAAIALATPAFAQDTTTAGAAAAQGTSETDTSVTEDNPGDIVVTAQKRSERLQDVPVAVSVISGDLLAQQGGVNLESAQYLVPTLNFRKSGTSINQSLFLRGVGTSTFSIAGEPSISTVVDGVVYARAGEAFSDLVDIDRLEVLRGPQGTLFGKNASAGVINIITRRPGNEFGGFVEAGYYTNRNEYRGRLGLDIPFSDTIKSRVTAFYGNYDGNIFNRAVDERVNGYEHYGVRGMIVADPTPDLSLTLIADYRESKDDCCAEVIGTTPANLTATVLPPANGDESREIAQNLVTRTEEKSWGVSLQGDWTLGTQTVTSITSYREYDNTEIRDGDFLPAAYVGFVQLHDVGPQVGDTFSQELRLTSPQNQFLEYVLGAYYSRAYSERTFTRNDIVCSITPPAPTVLTPCSTPGTTVTRPTGTANFGSTFKNFALFGQATLNVAERFRLIGGLRYTNDQLDVFHQRVTTLAGPGIQPSFGPFRGKTTNDNFSGKAGAQFDIVPESTAYATYARGYKGPAFNVFYNLTATGTNVIEPETADSFEVGLKNTLLGGRVVVNLAAYYAKYENYQANNPDIVAGVLVTRFTNAGDISTRGAELDIIVQPIDDFNISGGVAYTDAKVDEFRVPTNGVVTGVVPPGTELGYAPKWKGSLALDYTIRTGGAVDFQLGAQGSYQSSQLAQFDANAAVREATTIDGYGLLDLSASVLDAGERFRLTVQVKNVFDTSFAAAITSGGPGGSYRYLIPREADRYVGIVGRVSY